MSKKQQVKFLDSEDKMLVKTSYDFTENLKRMERHREQGVTNLDGNDDYRFIGEIPLPLITEWLREAGVSWDDVGARSEVVKRKILSGDFDAFRSDWKRRW